MISELRDVKCKYCGKNGLSERKRVYEALTISDESEIGTGVFWICECSYCKKDNKLLWEFTPELIERY